MKIYELKNGEKFRFKSVETQNDFKFIKMDGMYANVMRLKNNEIVLAHLGSDVVRLRNRKEVCA